MIYLHHYQLIHPNIYYYEQYQSMLFFDAARGVYLL